MAEVLRAPTYAGEMADTVEPLGLENGFAKLNLATAQGGRRGSHSYVVRLPRRAFSCTDQTLIPTTTHVERKNPPQTPRQPTEFADVRWERQCSDDLLAAAAAAAAATVPRKLSPIQQQNPVPQRPALPGPQRSYSVMDVEPVPFTHQPGTALTLPDLPAELHYAIFDLLDPIDSTCLGLSSRQFYAVFQRWHHTPSSVHSNNKITKKNVPLGAQREGPNDMEWVWRHAGPFSYSASKGSRSGNKQNTLAVLSPRGQVYCRKCRTARCELHKHIREFFPPEHEYCAVAQKFGRAAEEDARPVCYRSSPRHPLRCGRHTRQQRAVRLV